MKAKNIEIVNFKNKFMIFEYDFAIDRSSPLGNPFPINTKMDRQESIYRCKDWFHNAAHPKGWHEYLDRIKAAYVKHGRIRLFCWCFPLPCHGEIIKEHLIDDFKCHKKYKKQKKRRKAKEKKYEN